MKNYIILLLIAIFSLSCSLDGNLKATCTKIGLLQALTFASRKINKLILETKIPDQTGKTNGVEYSMQNIRIQQAGISPPLVNIANEGVEVLLPDCSLTCYFEWKWRKEVGPIKVGDSGEGELSLSNVRIQFRVVPVNKDGRMRINVDKDYVVIGNFKVKFTGGSIPDFIYKIFLSIIEDRVQELLEKRTRELFAKMIPEWSNKLLDRLPKEFQMGNVGIDLSFLEAAMAKNYTTVSFKGECFIWNNRTSSQLPKFKTPDSTTTNKHLELIVSETLFGTAPEAFYNTGKLDVEIDETNKPHGMPPLNTKTFKFIIPKLWEKFKDKELLWKIRADNVPEIHIKNQQLQLTATAKFDWYVKDSELTKAFTLQMKLESHASVKIEDKILRGTIDEALVKSHIMETKIGNFTTDMLDSDINMVLDVLVLPKINEKLRIALPSTIDYEFDQTEISLREGYLDFTTNIIFKEE